MTEPGKAPVPRRVGAGRGYSWFVEGYALFARDPLTWIIIAVIWLVLFLVSMTSSNALSLAFNLLAPVISGGLMIGCEMQRRGAPIRIEHLWAGFTDGRAGALLTLGVFSLLGLLLVGLGVIAALGASVGTALLSGSGIESLQIGFSVILALLIVLIVLTPIVMALWFAPALVAVHRVEPVPALKASFNACLVNMGSLTVQGLLMLPIAIVATIPLGFGWLIALPVFTASIYCSYRDIFSAERPATAPATSGF